MSKNHSKESPSIRLQKYIADCGITSRRKAEELILEGVVKVNDIVVTELGTKVDPRVDVVIVKGEVIDSEAIDSLYLVLNKPRSYVTTVSDPQGRYTVMDLVPIKQRVYPVGRLDYLSEGLLLLTNDGDFANMIMHPKYEITKTYEVKVFGRVTDAILKKLREGIQAEDGLLRPKSVRVVETLPGKTWLEFKLAEGKNREIRRICEACGITIDKLRRVAIGGLSISGIKTGEWKYITKNELLKMIGINKDGSPAKLEAVFYSNKKTIEPYKGRFIQKNSKAADDVAHSRYKKDMYYETLQAQRELLQKIADEKKVERKELIVKSMERTAGKAPFKKPMRQEPAKKSTYKSPR